MEDDSDENGFLAGVLLGERYSGVNFEVSFVFDGIDLGSFVKTVVFDDRNSFTSNSLRQTLELVFQKTSYNYVALARLSATKKALPTITVTELDNRGNPVVLHTCKLEELIHFKSVYDRGSVGTKLERFTWTLWRTPEVF